jgi:four helix bundle protein
MTVTRVEDFAAYEFAVRFKLEVYRLINESRGAARNQEYREQLEEAASGIEGAMSEGFGRRRPKEFALYLRYSLGSLNESKTRLRDGIHRGYFRESACNQAFTWAQRCKRATTELWRSQERRALEEERELKSKKAKSKGREIQPGNRKADSTDGNHSDRA